jgi:hypothetical protein
MTLFARGFLRRSLGSCWVSLYMRVYFGMEIEFEYVADIGLGFE